MTDYSGLVGRLRFNGTSPCLDAAASIEALAVEVERLKQYAPMPGGTPIGFVTRDLKIEAQRERIERLEEALADAHECATRGRCDCQEVFVNRCERCTVLDIIDAALEANP